MRILIDLTGQKFDSWLVLSRASNGKSGQTRWLCKCDCGREGIVRGANLRSGHSSGCRSCQVKRIHIKHGHCRYPLYHVWRNMIYRCEDLNCKDYKYYGDRGISICPGWRNDFMVFRTWALANGYKESLSIDRIDNNKGYFPENCQFLTGSENTRKAWRVDGSHGERQLKAS